MDKAKVELPMQTWNYITQLLTERPYREVAGLLTAITSQLAPPQAIDAKQESANGEEAHG